MSHVVLLGDSIFDNARYVPGGPAVIEQLQSYLPRDWRATLLAVDGAVAQDVARQLRRLPADATHLVVSAGGNDALEHSGLLEATFLTGPELIVRLTEAQAEFRRDYQELLRAVWATGLPLILCTVYDSIPEFPAEAMTALGVFNDAILREAFRAGLPVLDLRLLCDEARDYSSVSPIEPSKHGGFKIVRGIIRILTSHDFTHVQSVVYGKE